MAGAVEKSQSILGYQCDIAPAPDLGDVERQRELTDAPAPRRPNLPSLRFDGGRWHIDEKFQPCGHGWDWGKNHRLSGSLYVVECHGFLKIGSTTNLKNRLAQIGAACPLPVRRVASRNVPLVSLTYAEGWIHEQFRDRCVKGEWFSVTEREAVAALSRAVRRADAFYQFTAEWWEREERGSPDSLTIAPDLSRPQMGGAA